MGEMELGCWALAAIARSEKYVHRTKMERWELTETKLEQYYSGDRERMKRRCLCVWGTWRSHGHVYRTGRAGQRWWMMNDGGWWKMDDGW